MKPKLLITLGCSMTEGWGGYDTPYFLNNNYKLNKKYQKDKFDELHKDYESDIQFKTEFRKNSWPNRVGKKLGFDKVINLGLGGSSNSHHVKYFYEWINKNDISNYDVLVIWLMTEPVRFSFYIDGKIKSFMTNGIDGDPLAKIYVKTLGDLELDSLLEQKHYIESLENFCYNKKINLLITSWHPTFPLLYNYYNTDRYLFKKPTIIYPPFIIEKNGDYRYISFDLHPTKYGYDWMSDKIIQGIQENHSIWYNENPNSNIIYEWDGYPLKTQKIKNLI